MKKLILFFVFGCTTISYTMAATADSVALVLRAQRNADRAARHCLDGKENNLFVGFATGQTNHNQRVLMLKAEYDRQIRGNFFLGSIFTVNLDRGNLHSYDWSGYGRSPYWNTVTQDIYKLDAMAYYRCPVVESRLFFRVGTGVGVGYHHIRTMHGENEYQGGDKVLPYLS